MAAQEILAISQTQASNRSSISALLELIRQRDSFFVTSHARPDGDALCSALGMMYLLEAMDEPDLTG